MFYLNQGKLLNWKYLANIDAGSCPLLAIFVLFYWVTDDLINLAEFLTEAKEFPRSIDSPLQILCHPAVEVGKKAEESGK